MKLGSENCCPSIEKAMDHTVSYAEELEREAEECAGSLYDAFYVELALVKRDSWRRDRKGDLQLRRAFHIQLL